MPVETPSIFAQVIKEHLDLKQRNARLGPSMPIEHYNGGDPFENHPLFKTEEQARVEDTMDGVQSIVDEPTSLDWPTSEDTLASFPAVEPPAAPEEDEPSSEQASDESLWTRSRDFDWGD